MPPKKRTRKGAKPILETPFRVLEDENQAGPSTQHVTSPTTSIDPIISINTQSLIRSGRVIKPRRLQEYDYCDDEPVSTFDPEELDISSDSDQSDEEQQDEDEIPVVAGETPAEQDKAPKNPWMSKDQGTIWTSIPPSPNQRTRSHNFLKVPEIGGPTDPNGTFNMSPVELFKMFVTTDHVRIILRHSNAHALSFRPAWKEIDEDELYSFIGILLFAGVDKRRNFPIDEIWSSDLKYLTVPIVATMSRTRFKDILRFLRFDDREAREQARRENNPVPKIGLVQEIFDPFVKALRDHFLPGKTLTVDEMLLRFRGRTKFRVYMKSKPGKYGIKVWVIVDADTGYILMMYIYEGKRGKDVDTGLGRKVVMQLAEPFLDKGRSITTDNFCTSMALANELLDRETTLLGTIRGHRVEIPPILANKKGRDPLSSTFGFHKDFTLVSYAPKKNRVVLLLSTEHHDDMVDDEDNPKKKPDIIFAYNESKGGVDTADQMVGYYSAQRATRRWPLKVFEMMLDVAGVNAFVIYRRHGFVGPSLTIKDRRDFLRSVAEGLMAPTIAARCSLPTAVSLPLHVKYAMEKMGYPVVAATPEPGPAPPAQNAGRRQRCRICGTTSRTRCSGCNISVCKTHKKDIHCCNNCNYVRIIHTDVLPADAVELQVAPVVHVEPLDGGFDEDDDWMLAVQVDGESSDE